eukprot:4917038-Prymnesium_polylepis.2
MQAMLACTAMGIAQWAWEPGGMAAAQGGAQRWAAAPNMASGRTGGTAQQALAAATEVSEEVPEGVAGAPAGAVAGAVSGAVSEVVSCARASVGMTRTMGLPLVGRAVEAWASSGGGSHQSQQAW